MFRNEEAEIERSMPWLSESSSSGFESVSETEIENRNFSICSALSPTRIKEKVPKKLPDSSTQEKERSSEEAKTNDHGNELELL